VGNTAIRAEGLGKLYRIGERQKYKALRDTLTNAVYSPFRIIRSKLQGLPKDSQENSSVWALKDVSFEINQGEVVGVIGRNGAGKSTLLKILSRITEPTEGFVDIQGRVGSLLEVGTGFHPELTGRENIYLNGSIIGMKKAEIDRKFDEIVDFAEIEQFLDTAVKFYSSGMYMRLAFSVAAHLEPEILLVDEVLAVGDTEFQKKCLGKMDSVAKEGRTVLFISHNMPAVRMLCQRGLLFEAGRLILTDTSAGCVNSYLSMNLSAQRKATAAFAKSVTRSLWMRSATVLCNGSPSTSLYMGDTLSLCVEFGSERPIKDPRLGFVIMTHDRNSIINTNNRFQSSPKYDSPVFAGQIHCNLGSVPLVAGLYEIDLYLGNHFEDTHIIEGALTFEVIERDIWGQGQIPPSSTSYLWWPSEFHFHSV
jgi:lipopolysaccharide transport system ATP-binding protein